MVINMGETDVGWGISVERMMDEQWSVGFSLSHLWDETYLFINFFKWTISIGKIRKEV